MYTLVSFFVMSERCRSGVEGKESRCQRVARELDRVNVCWLGGSTATPGLGTFLRMFLRVFAAIYSHLRVVSWQVPNATRQLAPDVFANPRFQDLKDPEIFRESLVMLFTKLNIHGHALLPCSIPLSLRLRRDLPLVVCR